MSMYNPAHPGEILKELLIEPIGITITDVSEHLNVSRKTLSKVLNGRGAITPEMALRLELAFKKPSADHWLRLQNAYDLWEARKNTSSLHVQPYEFELINGHPPNNQP
jgi:antitoxin HigA-1